MFIHRRDAEDAEVTRRRMEGVLCKVSIVLYDAPLFLPKHPQNLSVASAFSASLR